MAIQKLYLLPAGRCLVDKSALDTRKSVGEKADLPIWSYLIETTDGPILIDTGMPDAYIREDFSDDNDAHQIIPHMKRQDSIVEVLRRSGYETSDIQVVISSHWHFDHAGGNAHFRHTPIWVQQAEYDAAMNGDGYPPDCRVPGLNYHLLNGDVEVVPGLRLLFTPGHSLGHQSVWLELPKTGAVLLTIDASYTRENFEDEVPFAGADTDLAMRSVQRLQDLVQSEKPKVFFGHDTEQEKAWQTFPAYYG